MKRRSLIIVCGLLIITGSFYYLAANGKLSVAVQAKNGAAVQSQAVSGREDKDAGTHAVQEHTEGPAKNEEGEIPTVEIPPDRQQMIGVKTVLVSVRPLDKIVRTVGRIEYDERRIATVNTKFEGWVEKIHVDYTGRYVKKGEPLAEVYSPELFATQQEFLNALRWSSEKKQGTGEPVNAMLTKDADALRDAARQRMRLWDISDDQIRKIEETGKPVRTLTVYSPVSGNVVQKMALQGMRVMPGEKLFDIADLGTVWIIADIYENDLPLIRAGQTAKIGLSYFPGREFSSTMDYVYPAISGETRTAKVRFVISNPGGQLKPQMFTNVEVKIPLGKRLVIPDEAVLDTGTRQIVYVDKGEGYFEPREVRTGLKAEGFQEVLAGLKEGEKVAFSATFLIDSEAQLKGVRPLEGHQH